MSENKEKELSKELEYLNILYLKYPQIFNENYHKVSEELTQEYFNLVFERNKTKEVE